MRITSAVDLLWRALAVLRVGALGWVTVLVATRSAGYDRPALGWAVYGGMVAWTAFITWAYARLLPTASRPLPGWLPASGGRRQPLAGPPTPGSPARRRGALAWPWLAGDLAVALACLSASAWVLGADELRRVTLPMAWVAAPVVAWAIHGGRRAGAVAALAVGLTDALVRGWRGAGIPSQVSLNSTVLLLLAGIIVGYVSRLAAEAQRRLQRAAEQEAATRERERLARGIHDSVLQVLALVQRRGAELGGEAAALGRLAGEQEATLRALVAGGTADPPGTLDLSNELNRYASAAVTIAVPAEPVPLPQPVATELVAAVGAALDNVRTHCGPDAPAWVLVEAEPEAVTVTVRDDGPGIPPGRLERAAAEGRLGVAQSIQARLRELGGTATLASAPGQGTEVELRLPWPHGSLPPSAPRPGAPGDAAAGDGGGRPPDVARRRGPGSERGRV